MISLSSQGEGSAMAPTAGPDTSSVAGPTSDSLSSRGSGLFNESSMASSVAGNRGKLRQIGQRFFLSALLLAMFGEWLYPLHSFLGGEPTKLIVLFMSVTGILLVTGCLRLPPFLAALLPSFLVAGSLLFLHGQEEGVSWFVGYAQLFAADFMEIVQSGRLYGISEESRTLLLLVGWTLLVVSVQMLALSKHSVLLFFSATLLYLIALETVGEVPVYPGLLRSAALGLVLQTLLLRNHLGEDAPGKSKGIGAGAVVAAGCVMGALLLSSLLPVQPARDIPWNRVVAALERWSGSELTGRSSESYAVSGYSKDDSRLGAPLRLRHETYFTAVSPQNTYWRGESKSIYTGQGWISSPVNAPDITEAVEMEVESMPAVSVTAGVSESPNGTDAAGVVEFAETAEELEANGISETDSGRSTAVIKQRVLFKQPVTGTVPFFSGGSPVKIEHIFAGHPESGSKQVSTRQDPDSDAVYFERAFLEQEIYGYELTARLPSISSDRLRLIQGEDPAEISNRNLELSDHLPDRVRKLGTSLVENRPNRYDAVMAVMDYLEKHHIYSLDTESPPEGADFVDYFLFGQKIGYCDHFSTAMTVLLRSGGIPARWVKGFAPGTPVTGEENRYNVSYADAHAWVEVYFPGEGWIPFDPTPGYESVVAAGTAETSGASAEDQKSDLWRNLRVTAKVLMTGIGDLILQGWTVVQGALFLWTSIVLGAGFALFAAVIYRKTWFRESRYLLWLFMLRRSRKFPSRSELLLAADRVWQEMHLAFGPKASGMTAREYTEMIAARNGGQNGNLESFVSIWETLYYGRAGLDRTESRDFLKLCRNLAFQSR
ncbi:transglutaminase superfamily protein [Fontibacillus phaseoli]|uniref:Transglutaminase superfamily protein n=1 Tax=Fontibacillus phaseoli TaxID=1416533 RepID=A0A369B6L3_9BACL|nr:transglutaminase domain-containing protein [Fontibacillus phaseoli]RCX16248.1 transglutaminase superfamily protein [Fontibacillus phaseoli]